MVQQYQSPVRVYKHPFELVMAAYEKRFPTCKMIPIFAGSDITFESLSDDLARHVVERRCKLVVDAPYLVKKIIGVEHVYFIQKNSLDRRARTLHIEAHNESFSSRVVIVETCRYYVHPENSSWTCFEQTASLDVKSFFGFENAIEKVAIKQYSTNIKKGKEVIEYYISELLSQGVGYIAPFGSNDCDTVDGPLAAAHSNANSTSANASSDPCADANGDVHPSCAGSECRRDSRVHSTSLDADFVDDGAAYVSACASSRSAHQSNDVTSSASVRNSVVHSQSVASTCAASGSLLLTGSELPSSSAHETARYSHVSSNGETPAQSASNSIIDVRQNSANRNSRLTAVTSSISGGSSASTLGDSPSQVASNATQAHEAAGKLDDVYIQRFLGALTPVEESRLLQLRDAVRRAAGPRDSPPPSDATMLRFLRARGCNVEKAREMLSRSLSWRRRHSIDSILASYEPGDVLTRYFAGGWHYFDKQDRPLYLLRLGSLDVKGLLKSVGEERALRHVLYACEQAVTKLTSATRIRGHPVSACTVVIDLDGLGMRHLWRPGIRALLRIIEHLEAHYPEMLHRVLIVRAPRIFPILWTLVSPFIDENTRQKFVVYSGREHVGPHGLSQFIDRQYLPVELAGECEWCDVPEGGLVPKAAYRFEHDTWAWPADPSSLACGGATSSSSDDDADTEAKPLSAASTAHSRDVQDSSAGSRRRTVAEVASALDPVYRVAYLTAQSDGRFEMRYKVAHAGAVITWDFEVLSGDVQFELFSQPLSEVDAETDADGGSTTVPPFVSSQRPTNHLSTTQSQSQPQHHQSQLPTGRRSAAAVSDDSIVSLSLSGLSTASPSFSLSTNSSGYMTSAGAPTSSSAAANAFAFDTAQTFKNGASVQGSHITTRGAEYVLRWTKLAIAGEHEAKLSYHTELVSSAQFHGSLTSLRSCRSSLCSLEIPNSTRGVAYRPSPLTGAAVALNRGERETETE